MVVKKVSDKQKDDFIKNKSSKIEKAKGTKKGDKQQVTITLTPEILIEADKLAAKMGMNRSAFFSLAIFNLINQNQ